jgi:hypothetical protein
MPGARPELSNCIAASRAAGLARLLESLARQKLRRRPEFLSSKRSLHCGSARSPSAARLPLRGGIAHQRATAPSTRAAASRSSDDETHDGRPASGRAAAAEATALACAAWLDGPQCGLDPRVFRALA